MSCAHPKLPRRRFLLSLAGGLCAAVLRPSVAAEDDPYVRYIKTSRDFQPVRQEAAMAEKAFPHWLYMPWTYQWTLGYNEASGKWSQAHGYNGAFLDGNGGSPDSPPGKLAWINRFGLRFYVDHLAGKGDLHLWDGGKQKPHLAELHGNGVRSVPLNENVKQRLKDRIRTNINAVKSSPQRAAYALDDEASWGHFVHPAMWCVSDDPKAYPAWLAEVYGPAVPKRDRWITYEDLRPKLSEWSLREFDAGPLLDQWTFNDAAWSNFLGDLVEYSNSLDPETPCGIVGGQSPNAFGGYDYARLMRKLQFIEAYNLGSSQAIIRSFSPPNAVPAVTSHFHQSAEDDIWQTWYYLAHGNRGHIGWVEGWFDGETPKPWHEQVAPHYREAGQKIAPLLEGAEWLHDGVAIYYSHPSIQLGWVLDAAAHGKTWVNRDSDHRLGSSHLVRRAWENMLRDSGLQYSFLSYVDVIQRGVPAEYRVLILPACLCLSDAEARAIEAFVKRGGTVIADYMPGLWDHHGRGRANGGALDHLFGIKHDPAMTAKDVFNGDGKLWCEADQDANYSYKTYAELLTKGNTCVRQGGFHKAVRTLPDGVAAGFGAFPSGRAVLLNLSPQWYNAFRTDGFEAAKARATFIRPVRGGGVEPRVEVGNAGPETFGHEITYFRLRSGRTLLFLCLNPEVTGSETGGGNAAGLRTGKVSVTLNFAKTVRGLRDERRDRAFGDGERFTIPWVRNEAVVLSWS